MQGRPPRITLAQAYAALLAFAREHGMPPTTSEFAKALGYNSKDTGARYLKALAAAGKVTLWAGARRGMVIKGWSPPKVSA